MQCLQWCLSYVSLMYTCSCGFVVGWSMRNGPCGLFFRLLRHPRPVPLCRGTVDHASPLLICLCLAASTGLLASSL
jgi:hypothetical protein